VYTDPSKPPAIGDLAVLEQGLSPVGGVTMALNAASLLSPIAARQMGSAALRDDGIGAIRWHELVTS
jgi:hypothetical protein